MKQLLWFLAMLCCTASAATAGPNAGGVLWVHDTGIVFSTDLVPPPVSTPPADCAGVDNQQDVDGIARIWKVYAAFPPGSHPRLKAAGWAIQFPEAATSASSYVSVVGGGVPDEDGEGTDFYIGDLGFPIASGGQIGQSFPTGPRTTTVVALFYFYGFGYNAGGPFPIWSVVQSDAPANRVFGDDAEPTNEDPIMGYGSLGFGTPGATPCPTSDPLAACCTFPVDPLPGDSTVVCRLRKESDCPAPSSWHAEWYTCTPRLCPEPTGACCYTDGRCQTTTPQQCSNGGGDYQGNFAPCATNPCLAAAACCMPSGTCLIRTQVACVALSPPGTWHAEWLTCTPNPCPFSPSGPDLVVRSLTWQPENPQQGDYVYVTAVVKNQGDQWAGESQAAFLVDGSVRYNDFTYAIAAGDSTRVSGYISGMSAGMHQIQVCADYWNYVNETNEGNNCRVDSLVVRRMEYYVPSGLSYTPGQDSVVIPIYAATSEEMKAYSVRLRYDPYVFECLDLTVQGTRGEGAFMVRKNCGLVGDPSIAVIYRLNCPGLAGGDGPIAKLIARVRPNAPLGPTQIYFQDNTPSLNRITLCDGTVTTPRLSGTNISIITGFVRSDVDGSGELNISDPIYNLGYQVGLLPPPHCLDAADDDDSGEINVGDPVYSLGYQFAEGPEPPAPFAACGADPTPEAGLSCDFYPPCEGSSSPEPVSLAARMEDVRLTAPVAVRGGQVRIPVSLANRTALWGFEFTVSYNPGRVELLAVERADGAKLDFFSGRADPKTGTIRVGAVSDYRLRSPLAPGERSLGWLRFKVLPVDGPEDGKLALSEAGVALIRGRFVNTDFAALVLGGEPGAPAEVPNETADEFSGSRAPGLGTPNPFPARSVIDFRSPTAGDAAVEIYNALGQHVRTLFAGQIVPGSHALVWDGRSDSGEQLGTGVYFVRATVGTQNYRRMIILTR